MKQKILYKPNKLSSPSRNAVPGPSHERPRSEEQGEGRGAADPGIASDQLLGPHGELKIRHNGELYSLRKTRFNKLILTK